ncbi:MAG: hypothetical protein PVF44_17550 [Syntrophobacterales bacterium]|jgi:hypothetical protein
MNATNHSSAGLGELNQGPLQVVPVEGRRDLRRFIHLPWAIYAEDPAWVPPLILERRQHLSHRNPYFAHAKYRAWIAYRDARPVGRISAQVDQLHLERYQDDTGFFGMLEAEDDAETFRILLDTAETWLRDQGMRRVLGPFNLSVNQECGLLVEGYDTPPSIMMGHARPYYAIRIEEQGYRQEKELLAYRVNADFEFSAAMQAAMKRASRRVRVRPLRRSHFAEDLKVLQDIFEDAWSENWGFVPFTEAEFEHLGETLKLLVREDYIQIAEVEGVPAAMMVALPNINEAIQDLNGRLLPHGWLKLLWRLKIAHPKSVRVALMGVRKRYQKGLLGGALALMVIQAVRAPAVRRGVLEAEMSWILDDNIGMQNIIESIGGIAYKRYRIFGKELV